MCGINGRVNYRTGAPVAAGTLEAMCDLLQHRGPDGFGVWTDGDVGFGHRRLAVIDPSSAGRQPLSTPDGRFTITFNGEIYNFQDLRRDLEQTGCRFVSRTDTEVILRAYERYGTGCLERLRGMFAFAIWDAHERRLFAARDRAGQKPFYYREDADGLAFASEPKAFLAEPSFVPEVDPEALFHYLSFQYVPSPGSAFRGLRRLPPAHFLIVDRGRVTIDRYWTLRYSPKAPVSAADATEQIRTELAEATRIQLVSDVPLGAFLSGGIDSSLVVALMAQAGGRVKTFSIGFDDQEYDELAYARQVADRFGTDHHEAIVRPDAVAILPKLVWHYNEPFADSSAVPTLYLSEMTRRHVTVALNGDAGDESFAGYERYAASRLAARLDAIPLPARRALARWTRTRGLGGRPRSTQSRLQRFLQAAADSRARRYARWMFHFDDSRKREICTPELLARAGAHESGAYYDALFALSPHEDLLDATLRADVERYLPDDLLIKVDIATMAYGLESRSPLLDHVLMERAAVLPVDLKLHGTTKKYLLKRIARGLLPDAVIDRPKMGFGVPLDRWFRGPLRELAHDVLLGSRLRSRGYFQPDAVERLLREHESGQRNWHYQLWNLLVLELWHQTFIDARPAPVHVRVAPEVTA